MEIYLKQPVLSHSQHIHPLEYWQSKKAIWPILAHLASKYLSISLSSATSEQLFSSASDIVFTERNRLLPEKAEMLLFIKKNLPIVGYASMPISTDYPITVFKLSSVCMCVHVCTCVYM